MGDIWVFPHNLGVLRPWGVKDIGVDALGF